MTLLFDTAIVKEGGAEPVIESLNITPTAQQQIIEAPSGVDGYSPITVAAASQPVIESLSITPTASEQLIEAPEGVDGYSPITVAAVPQDTEPEIDFVSYGEDTGYIVISNKLLSDALKERSDRIYEGDEVMITTMGNCIQVEGQLYSDTYRIGFTNPFGRMFDYNNLTQGVHEWLSDDGNTNGGYKWVSSAITTCYLSVDLGNNPPSYFLFDSAQSSWYNYLTWSFNVSYDIDTNILSVSNFQRIN